MTIDPRAKGARAETLIRDQLRTLTKLQWERVPASGALDAKHGLKGDLYVPNEKNLYVVEIKHYEEDHLTSKVLTGKSPQFFEWWEQALRQGRQVDKIPLLLFKFDRSKVFAAFTDMPTNNYRWMLLNAFDHEVYVSLLDEWHNAEKPKFI